MIESTTNISPAMRAKAWGLALVGLLPVYPFSGADGPSVALSVVVYLITTAILGEVWLRAHWLASIALCYVAAMFFSPADPVSMIIVAVPLYAAFGLFAWLQHRAANAPNTSTTTN